MLREVPIALFIKNMMFRTGKRFLSVIDKNDVILAIKNAYLAMSPRTVKEVGTTSLFKKVGITGKYTVFDWLAEMFIKYFRGEPPINFDDWHNKVCEEFLKRFNDVLRKSGYNPVQYGKAQKIVNVTFKNLYLYDDAFLYEEYFYDCHFILSSENLDWYKHNVNSSWRKIAWSNLNYKQYIEIQENIREYFKNNEKCYKAPFIAEFFIWSDHFL